MICPSCREAGAEVRKARLAQVSTVSTHKARQRSIAAHLLRAESAHMDCAGCDCQHHVPDLR